MKSLTLLVVSAAAALLFHLAPHDLTREQAWLAVSIVACIVSIVGAIRHTPGDRFVAVGVPATVCTLAVLSGMTEAGLPANLAGVGLVAFVLRRTWRYQGVTTPERGTVDALIVAGAVLGLLLLGADLTDPANVVRALTFATMLGLFTRAAVRRGTLVAPVAIWAAAVLSWTVGLGVELHLPEAVLLREVFVAIAWLWAGVATLHPDFADLCGPPELRSHRRALLRLLLYASLLVAVTATTAVAPAGADTTIGRLIVAAVVFGVLLGRLVELLRHGDRELANVRERSLTDPLTGLANRAGLVESLEQAAQQGRTAAVLMVDIDDFRMLNDGLGFAVGDRLLMRVADRLVATVGGRGTVARLAADEFAIHLRQSADADGCRALATAVQTAIAAPVTGRAAPSLPLRVSIGVAPADGHDAEGSLRRAQVALTHAKSCGRGRVAFYDGPMAARAHEQATLVADLHKAIDRGELHLAYQPIFDVRGRRMVAVEALLRWQHPVRGSISPAAFIPLAESAGLIVPIGRWVLTEALRLAAELRTSGHHDLVMHVNLSPVQLRDDVHLLGHVQAALSANNVEPGGLLLEVTEGVLVGGDASLDTLEQVRRLGVRVGLDDFGTGYASINYLDRLSLDVVKLDKVFTGRVSERDQVGAGILRFLDELPFDIVAEGVEDPDEIGLLESLGCDMVQGYAFARPMDEDALRRFAVQATARNEHDATAARQIIARPAPAALPVPTNGSLTPAPDRPNGAAPPVDGSRAVVGRLTTAALTLDPTATCVEVGQWFTQHPRLDAVLVAAGEAHPYLLSRSSFDRQMVGALGYGSMLFSRRPVSELALTQAPPLPADLDLLEAVDAALSRPAGSRYDDLLVLDGSSGRYSVLSVARLLDAAAGSLSGAALRDSLTGLANRHRVIGELHRLDAAGVPFCIVVVDIDGFRELNSVHGHAAGDAVLRTVGQRLAAGVTHPYVTARTAADEFAVVMPEETDREAARRMAARVLDAVTRPVVADDVHLTVSASAGFATSGGHADPLGVLQEADRALVAARSLRRVTAVPA